MSNTFGDYKLREFNQALTNSQVTEKPDLSSKSISERFEDMFKRMRDANSVEIIIVGREVKGATTFKPIFKVSGVFTGWKDSNRSTGDLPSSNGCIIHIAISDLEATTSSSGLPCPVYNLKPMTDYVKVKNRIFDVQAQTVNAFSNTISLELVRKS